MDRAIKFKNSQAYYRIEGKGKTIMLLHGFIEEGSMWDEVVKVLQKSYQVIVPDLPGFGKSPLGKGHAPLSMELYAEYVLEILKREKIKQLVLLGHSMGGYITLYFTEKHGAILKGFGLISSHCFEDTVEKKKNRLKGIEFIRKHGTKPFVTELYNSIFHESFKRKNRKLIDGLIDKSARYTPEAVMSANAAMMNRTGKEDVLKNATVPVLFVNGKEDESAPLVYTLKQSPYPNVADVHFFGNCKHMCVFERKEETIQIIQDFCDRAFS